MVDAVLIEKDNIMRITMVVRDGTGTGDRPVRSGPGLDFVPAGLPFDRSRPVDRPVCSWTGHDR
jgi:hypothetical protein